MGTESKNFKLISRDSFEGPATIENITVGCMQRIADGVELMAASHQKLIDDAQYYKKQTQYFYEKYIAETRRSPAYRGHITRLKNQLSAANQIINDSIPIKDESL